MSDDELFSLSGRVGARLRAAGWRLATAESCTAGWVAKAVTDVAGSSDWFDRGFVTYSDQSKQDLVGVAARTLEKHGAVSEATVREMAAGALERSKAHIVVAISGIAGPGGGTPEKPVGTVWFCVACKAGRARRFRCERKVFRGNRDSVRRRSVQRALQLVLAQTPR